MLAKRILIIFIILDFSCVVSFAGDDDPDIDAIEAEFIKKREEPKAEPAVRNTSPGQKETSKNNSEVSESQGDSGNQKESDEALQSEQIRFSDLSKLAPFSEVSVIQKKYMPKTKRFQLHFGANYLSNNPFYQTVGLVGKLAFNFTEYIGLELTGMTFGRAPRYVTDDLKSVHSIETSSIVTATNYYGLDLVLTPFYGKITWFDERIIPFDFYLSLGGGMTSLYGVKDQASTFHFGIGQIYSLTKNFVVRWDLSGNNYSAKVASVGSSTKRNQSFNDVFLGGGISFLFPGASYR